MRKSVLIFTLIVATMTTMMAQDNIYGFTVKDITGKDFSFADLKGKKIMIVNTASKCGFTPQYAELQKLYEEFGGENFTIIGFPANNFMKQEPGSNEEIAAFCEANYGVTFPMMSKISVKGKDQHPIYAWLTKKSFNGKEDSSVSWNFQKYLIDENGMLVGHVATKKSPYSDEILSWIEE